MARLGALSPLLRGTRMSRVAPSASHPLRKPPISPRRLFSSSTQKYATWGFIGLGQMGYNMAKNIQSKIPATDTLMIRDVNQDTTVRFVEEARQAAKRAAAAGTGTGMANVVVAESARDMAEQATVVITSLPEPQHVKDVFYSILRHGELPPLEQERLFIDTSTIDPSSSKEIANAIHTTGQGRFVDAPVSGGVVGARNGTLSFMFGATSQTGQFIDRVRSVLSLMGKNAWHMGAPGAGVSGKLVNNYILAINNIATAEAMNLGLRWGLDPKTLADMVSTSTGRCWPMEVNNPVPGVVETAPASRDYAGGFGVSLMKKDLRLAITAAEESGSPLPLADVARTVYNAVEEEHRGKDFSVVYKWLQDKSQ
ncbi:NAD(P)-dependent oxidoreductase [Aspergillus aculeatinus CBS 121060]|uniref:3-hydroxyisobutyrate dehydrogenase n=1 Tax=Aspergillus aculeatinus CBS 121060 TaxID=1448322 RepID=A0ACD1HI87_9EURO|nr:putative 3-hydroxyisobutyrate dehydrogenase [Aspergillus aculeatinus CBS 121060]RAH73286.1 putative 3-hydroxyisobutyrate dehydrogenase [Aspergillus aculeatinus CBS 121060]